MPKSRIEDNTLKRYLDRTLTVDELIGALEEFPRDMKVMISYDYGDHWHTPVCESIGEPLLQTVVWSGYHNKPKIDYDGDDEPNDEPNQVLILGIEK